MTEREARIAFNLIPAVGSVTVDRLAREAGGSVAAAYELFPDKRDWEGRTPDWERELARAEKMHVTLVTQLDAAYPPQLKEIASPPLVLYVVGDPAVLSRPSVALVGTRACTDYGRETAERLAAGLAERGWMILSGLALGIDAAAHRGALLAKGATAGILGGALDKFYPNENRDLAREIVDRGGCVATEFPFGRGPDAQTFPQRNRVVAGLARGVVAVECPRRSGTLITCARALEMGRVVMAVPGRVDWKCAAGSNQLLREGARPVTCADDVASELAPLATPKVASASRAAHRRRSAAAPAAEVPPPPPKAKPAVPEATFTLEEAAVLRALPAEGMLVDTLARQVALPISKINTLLVALRLKGRVRFLPGGRVAPAERR